MTDADLPPKRKIPKWVWILGGGCLMVGIGLVAALVFAIGYLRESQDPAEQWPRLALYLPFEAEPDGWTIQATPTPGSEAEAWVLSPPHTEDQLVVTRFPKAEVGDVRESLFDEVEVSADAPLIGPVGRFDPLRGVVTIRGREFECLRYFTTPGAPEKTDGLMGAMQSAAATSNLLIDVSTDPEGDLITVELRRPRTRQRIPDEALVEILQPFRIGTP